MSEDGKEELDSGVRELVDRAADPEPAPDGARDEVWSRLEESVLDQPPGGEGDSGADGGADAGGGDGSTGAASDLGGATEAASGAAEGMGTETAATGLAQLLGGANIVQTATAFLLGTGVGAGGYAAIQSATAPEPRSAPAVAAADTGVDAAADATGTDADAGSDADVSNADAPDVTARPDADSGGDETASADPAPRETAPRTADEPTRPGPEDQSDGQSTLAAERRLLSRAQTALTRGRPQDALETLQKHRREFPSGGLVEERRALRVRALARAGRVSEARRAGRAFLTDYPDSIFRGVVERVVDELPESTTQDAR